MTTEKTNLKSIIDSLETIAAVESREDIYDENGEFKGSMITYANPLHPELKTVYHPYIPLQVYRVNSV